MYFYPCFKRLLFDKKWKFIQIMESATVNLQLITLLNKFFETNMKLKE